jgi:glycine oxidase
MLACELLDQGWRVTLFDRDGELGAKSCGWTGAGMLAPFSELDGADDLVFRLGVASTLLWPKVIKTLPQKVFLQMAGSLIVAHNQDRPDLARLQRQIERRLFDLEPGNSFDVLDLEAIKALEPELGNRFSAGLYLPREGQVDNRQLYDALAVALRQKGASWRCNTEALKIEPFKVITTDGSFAFGHVVDCRGLGAKRDLTHLRGVRGEIIRIEAPDVSLNRPVRLIHPRYPLYVVPREKHRFVVGATLVESEDDAPMTVQSALELLSAAFSLHPGFANASILEMGAACRPALPDNSPRIFSGEGLMRINGLYRHGFLVAPKLAQLAVSLLKGEKIAPDFDGLVIEEKCEIANSR